MVPVAVDDLVEASGEDSSRRKIRLVEVNAKCRHLKNACKDSFRQVFIRVYSPEIANLLHTFIHVGFQPSCVICTLPCCPSLLLSGSTLPPPPFPV
jgi:hypothetical protein